MKTIKWIGSVILIFIFVGHLAAEQAEVIFFNGTVESAREKARNESKLYFIEFYAKWCDPCKWMDEHTFKNTALSSYVDANYVPVKVDVENIDGFVWKQKYKVQYLPTIIILNGEGNMLGKYEKAWLPVICLKYYKIIGLLIGRLSLYLVYPARTMALLLWLPARMRLIILLYLLKPPPPKVPNRHLSRYTESLVSLKQLKWLKIPNQLRQRFLLKLSRPKRR
ncbi:MAG: thioredoxin family protein [Saprospiraceae bacterium]|nr:thioredoxin family protein [Saprospiraceae bacterium]